MASKLHDHPSSQDAAIQKMGETSAGSKEDNDQPDRGPVEGLYATQAKQRKSMLDRHATERKQMNSRHETEHKDMADQHLGEQADAYNKAVDAQNAQTAPAPPKSPVGGDQSYSRGR